MHLTPFTSTRRTRSPPSSIEAQREAFASQNSRTASAKPSLTEGAPRMKSRPAALTPRAPAMPDEHVVRRTPPGARPGRAASARQRPIAARPAPASVKRRQRRADCPYPCKATAKPGTPRMGPRRSPGIWCSATVANPRTGPQTVRSSYHGCAPGGVPGYSLACRSRVSAAICSVRAVFCASIRVCCSDIVRSRSVSSVSRVS